MGHANGARDPVGTALLLRSEAPMPAPHTPTRTIKPRDTMTLAGMDTQRYMTLIVTEENEGFPTGTSVC